MPLRDDERHRPLPKIYKRVLPFGRSKPLPYGVRFRKTVGVAMYVFARDKKNRTLGIFLYAEGSVCFFNIPDYARGCAFSYTSFIWLFIRFEYTCVDDISACPIIA